MGKGSRHSKNAGTMGTEGLTYHERKAMGHGTLKERLGKDSQGNFFDCAMTLQPAKDPLITPDGYLFSREAILEYFVGQKKEKKRQLAEWEADEKRRSLLDAKQESIQKTAEVEAFERQNMAAASTRTTDAIAEEGAAAAEKVARRVEVEASGHAIQMNEDRARSVKSFWQPQDTPDSDRRPDKPLMEIVCPVSAKKLRLKDMVDVKFTPVPEGTDGLYMDPISKDTLTNTSQIVVLKATGDAMLKKTYETCIKPDGHFDGQTVREKDVIKLIGGGTGFSGREGQQLQSEKKYTLGPGSGRADLRGQAAGGASRFGLAFRN